MLLEILVLKSSTKLIISALNFKNWATQMANLLGRQLQQLT